MGIIAFLKQNWVDFFSNIEKYKFLIHQLVRVDILSGYKKSYIGVLWMIIYPILSVIIWIVLNGAGVIEPGEMSIPYPAYVLLSTSIWGFFIGIYQTTSQIIVKEGRIMIMNKFPQEVLLINKLIVHFILFLIPFIVNIVVLLIYGIKFSWLSLLFPFALIPLLLIGMALGLVSAILRVVAVDLVSIIDEFLKLLMFLTPIVFTAKLANSGLSTFVDWNPLTYLIGFSRDLLTKGEFFETTLYMYCSLGAFISFVLAFIFFQLVGPKVLERLVTN